MASALIIFLAGVSQAQRPAVATHIVRHGESLDSIATAYGISLYELQATNNIWSWLIHAGQELEIPAADNVEVSPNESTASAESPAPTETSPPVESSGLTHKVQFGETLAKIAAAYGVSLEDLQSLNGVWTWIIYVGQELEIPAGGAPPEVQDLPAEPLLIQAPAEPPTSTASAAQEPPIATIESSGILHTVRFGESLSRIALAYGVSLTDLQSLNGAWSSIIHAGQELEIPAGGTPPAVQDFPPAPPAAQTLAESPSIQVNAAPVQNPDAHTVQPGETLFRIARRYGISLDRLVSINGIQDPTRIHAGNQLRLSPLTASAPPAAANSVAGSAPARQTAPAPASHGDRKPYIVRRGDFLTQLAIDLNTSWIALAKLNNLADPNNLHAGTALLIPERADVELYDPKYAAWKWFDMIGNQPGPRVGAGREIVIVLSTQSAYAYENGVLQKAARVSAGKKATPTIQGDHKIWLKRRSQTMSGPGYSLDNVEWVMYFYQDYAIHGAWWHMNFGQPTSHGCVNLTNADAKWFYEFSSIGTPVHVRA
ncbi:MAG: LysM peptidoglycan-binding domain-containing protein [Chloroflexi bacterium]|nr:LysM peptidoglycan-binding domain-containing protein [Chloroflexota bacterium]